MPPARDPAPRTSNAGSGDSDEPFVQRHPLVRRPRVCDTRATARDRRARAASAGPRCQESARGPASGRAGRPSAGETPHSPAPWSASVCPRRSRRMYARARRRSSASTSGVSCSRAPSSPSPHARSSSVTAPGDGVVKAFRTRQYRTVPRWLGQTVAFLERFRGCSPFRPAFPHSSVRAACRPSEGGNAMTRTCSRSLTVGLIADHVGAGG